jgi:hypothetical protein
MAQPPATPDVLQTNHTEPQGSECVALRWKGALNLGILPSQGLASQHADTSRDIRWKDGGAQVVGSACVHKQVWQLQAQTGKAVNSLSSRRRQLPSCGVAALLVDTAVCGSIKPLVLSVSGPTRQRTSMEDQPSAAVLYCYW